MVLFDVMKCELAAEFGHTSGPNCTRDQREDVVYY